MKRKICTTCGIEKGIKSFSKLSLGLYGRRSRCKECTKLYSWAYYYKNCERERMRTRIYRLRDVQKWRGYNKQYRQIHKAEISRANKEWKHKMYTIEAERVKFRARNMAASAARKGRIIKLSCEVCGELKSEGHHEDYSKPLEVRWLCHLHHEAWHHSNQLIAVT